MIVVGLYTVIAARLLADSTLVGLLNGNNVFDNYFSADQQMPFIVIDFAQSEMDDAFQANQAEVTVRVSLYASKQSADSATSSAIAQRIYGDSFAQATFVPTFGLHRWNLSVDPAQQGWHSASAMVWRRDYQEHEADYYHWVSEYTVRLYQVYTAPIP